jgi:hypothetical protein
MKTLCWALILLAALAFAVGTLLAFSGGQTYLIKPEGYWRGAMGFLAFAMAIRLMDDKH